MMCKQMMQVGHLRTVRRSKQIIKRSHVVNPINCWQHAGEAVGSQLECLSREVCLFFGMLWTDWTLRTTDVETGSLGPSS